MAEEVFKRNARVASQELWTRPEDLTDAQLAIPVVARWEIDEIQANGEAKAVDTISKRWADFTAFVVKKQDIQVADTIEVREAEERIDDVIVHFKTVRQPVDSSLPSEGTDGAET